MPRTAGGRAALGIVALLVGLNLIVLAIDALAPSPGGAPSSSFATEKRGFAAWAELARGTGQEVRALRRAPADGGLPRTGTVVILDAPGLAEDDARALKAFVEGGGHLVAGGYRGDELAAMLDVDLGWARRGPKAVKPIALPGVGAVRTAGEGAWRDAGELDAIAGPLLVEATAGRGRISLLADASPLQNRLLGEADNAALAVELAGDGPLAFVETAHGYGEASGLAALPARVKWALALLAAAALLFMAARGRRLGAPETLERPLAPPRDAYVDALAGLLARGGDGVTIGEPVRAAALERLRVDGTDAGAVVEAALAAGLGEGQAAALARPVETDDDAVAVARALARLEERTAGAQGRIAV